MSLAPQCIKRFGFKPIVQVIPEHYTQLLDAADKSLAIREAMQ